MTGPVPAPADVALLPDAGPLITLAYADALELLFSPGWSVKLVDMVLHEVTRTRTPTSEKLAAWAARADVAVLPTRTFARYRAAIAAGAEPAKSNLGELAIQETMNDLALGASATVGVFLFEDHKLARTSFLLPDNCRKISTRAYLLFLEAKGFIESAADIERRALRAGRKFSKIRFPANP